MRRLFATAAAALVMVSAAVVTFIPSPGGSSIPVAHAAAVDYFLKIEGVEGESADEMHRGEIQLESWSWGASQPGLMRGAATGGAGAGKVSVQDFHFTKLIDKASPILMKSTASGQHYPRAILSVRKAGGGTQEEYFKVTLEDVFISSYQAMGNQAVLPTDSFSLNFTKVTFAYTPTDETGQAGQPVIGSYDIKKNTAQ